MTRSITVELKLYNSLSKQKEVFKPMQEGKIKIYVCGVTVYDYCHIGHARTYLAFDVIMRFLRSIGYDVEYVRNITDIDDKIIKRAQEQNQDWQHVVDTFVKTMDEDFASLGIIKPNKEPRATKTIPEILEMIQTLIDKGYAYVAQNQDVYFSVQEYKDYGALSGQNLESLRSGERVEPNPHKKHPYDFVLWKHAKPGEPTWSSPWGDGRPGWHIECSCMTKSIFGERFDIHGGGSDLRFPHHENELAQSMCANNSEAYANYWIHSGMVQINNEKMSKSLGNFFVIREVLESYRPEVLRYFLISAHYRSEINYSQENLDHAQNALNRFYTALRGLDLSVALPQDHQTWHARFNEAMLDDFNVPQAMAVLFELLKKINQLEAPEASAYGVLLKKLAGIFGLLQQDPDAYFQGSQDGDFDAKIQNLLAQRSQARQEKNWTLADTVRDELEKLDVVVEDTAQGPIWRKK